MPQFFGPTNENRLSLIGRTDLVYFSFVLNRLNTRKNNLFSYENIRAPDSPTTPNIPMTPVAITVTRIIHIFIWIKIIIRVITIPNDRE
jgi:hypothetical protein